MMGPERNGAQVWVVWNPGSLGHKVNKIIALLDSPSILAYPIPRDSLKTEIPAQPGASLAYLEGCCTVLLGVGGTSGPRLKPTLVRHLVPICPCSPGEYG